MRKSTKDSCYNAKDSCYNAKGSCYNGDDNNKLYPYRAQLYMTA